MIKELIQWKSSEYLCFFFKGESDGDEKMEGGDAEQFYSEQHYFDQSGFQMSTTIPDEDENSFDPSDFFMHSALATEAQQQLQHGDINEDLQVSDSDDSDNQGGDINEGFDIDEFLKWEVHDIQRRIRLSVKTVVLCQWC